MCWAGAITRSEATLPFAVTGSWCAAPFRSVGGHMGACRPRRWPRPATMLPPSIRREGGKRKARLCWPQTLRAVRGWLEPYVMLNRYWRAFCGKPPPPELEALLERVFSGRGLYLSLSIDNKLLLERLAAQMIHRALWDHERLLRRPA